MNIIANNVASKLFVAFVAASMLFTLATPSAKAATAEELQAQIAALMAQIAALTGAPASSAAACTFTRALTVGSEGADVKCLQDYLTPTYFTNAGGSTGYFGPVTAAAVAAWQTANGVMPAVGYFGPVSQAKYNALMASAPSAGGSTGSNDEDEDMSGGLSGEASLNSFDIESASDDTIEEGAEDAEIALASVEFEDGDAEISRIDVSITGVTDAWDVLDEVSLWVDGDEIARKSASDQDDYQDEDAGTLRFSGLDLVAMEDEEVEITIAATVQGTVDSLDQGTYSVSVDSIRFIDGDDVTDTLGAADDADLGTTVDFDIDEAGAEDELIIKTSDSDPDATTIALEDDARSGWETVFAFDMDTDDSVNDIEVNDLKVLLATTEDGTTATSSSLLISDVRLMLDGDEVGDATVTHNNPVGTASTTFDFDSGEVVIDAGDRVAFEVQVKFLALNVALEGATIQGSLTTTGLAAEGAEDLAGGQLSGSATGEEHTLRTSGINAEAGDITSSVTVVDGATNDYATYQIKFEVTAFEQDVYISTDPATSTNYTLEDGSGAAAVAGTRTVTLSSTADEQGTYFLVNEGDTETFTLKVTYIPGAVESARLQLDSVEFARTGVTPDQVWTASPDEDYRTDVEDIVG